MRITSPPPKKKDSWYSVAFVTLTAMFITRTVVFYAAMYRSSHECMCWP
jgi:hypothetical protein